MATSIRIASRVRDRLRSYRSTGMSDGEIITRLKDAVDRREFLEETRSRLQRVTGDDLVDLDAVP